MKRLLLILILVFAVISASDARMSGVMLSGAGTAAVGGGETYTDCSQIGTATFYYNADYSGDTDKGCTDASTAVDGTIGTGGAVVASGTDPGTESPGSGNNVFKGSGSSEYLRFGVADAIDATGSEGRIECDVYATATTSTITLFMMPSSSQYVKININSSGVLAVEHVTTSIVTMTGGDAISDGTWTHVQIRWSVTNNQLGVKVGDNDWDVDTDADAVAAFSESATYFYFYFTGVDDCYIDNVKIYATSGL